uniref:Uncharacterized protein n=1 Tax=Setaria viridis TaxID=4556 RepID=A0A4U6T1G1_SETVI|nr:hypothetical protein SEVIR_9G282533v2 [Setaria viridis]
MLSSIEIFFVCGILALQQRELCDPWSNVYHSSGKSVQYSSAAIACTRPTGSFHS